ncbi:MAG TPA: tyrosine-type recombinase/integrase [Solirubrobacteraceae bacterium]|nr:tyrosine-type recombinase/integrase [Solirubrobacteraceae bacterium]
MFRVERVRGPAWYAKYRLPDGRQVQRKLGPAWTERGRPPAGYFTKRLAEDWLRDVLVSARRGTLAGQAATGATFADAAAEWLRYVELDRQRKPSTLEGYRAIVRSRLLPAFGSMPLEAVTTETIEQWLSSLGGAATSRTKALVLLHGILKRARKVWGLQVNAAAEVEKPPLRRSGDIQVFSPEEVWSLARSAASEQDAAIYMTAAFTGLRLGELLALHWRDVDFAGSVIRVRASYAAGVLTTPKSGKVRAVPMAPDVATALAQLGQRKHWVGEDDLVFCGETGAHLDGSALRRRYKAALAAAGLRALRFHDLRHTFGTRMIAKADIRRVQEWMGHADIQTTMRYLHYAPRAEDARLVAEAFALDLDPAGRTSPDILGHLRQLTPRKRPARMNSASDPLTRRALQAVRRGHLRTSLGRWHPVRRVYVSCSCGREGVGDRDGALSRCR